MATRKGDPRRTNRWKQVRLQVLQGDPTCVWCKQRPATEADHVIPWEQCENPYDLDNLVPACKPCNGRRGADQLAKQNAAKRHARAGVFLAGPTPTPPPSRSLIPKNALKGPERVEVVADGDGSRHDRPRLVSATWGAESFGPCVASWAERNLGKTLFPWQIEALTGQLEHVDGKLCHREALVSTARQNGKTVALSALAGWWLTEYARTAGPQSVVTAAHKLDRAVAVFRELAPVLEEKFDAKITWSYGRNRAELLDGSVWQVMAATPSNAHGSSNDLVIIDEVWNISPEVIFDAYRPTMIARLNPLMSMWSTAGDEGSEVMLQLREQGMAQIETGRPSNLYFAEWSPPPSMDPRNPAAWAWANPALGHTITMDALKAAADTPNVQKFMRAHVNVWVSSANAWLPHGLWESLQVDTPMPDGGVLAVDSDIHENRYVGVRSVPLDDGRLQVAAEFIVDSMAAMWDEVRRILSHPSVTLAITPGLADICPPDLERRMTIVGSQEMYRHTPIARSLIHEKRVVHAGQITLAEHVSRAVLGRSQNSITLSSMKSPGPIELARCMVWAIGLTAKPKNNIRRPAMGIAAR